MASEPNIVNLTTSTVKNKPIPEYPKGFLLCTTPDENLRLVLNGSDGTGFSASGLKSGRTHQTFVPIQYDAVVPCMHM